MMIESGWTPTTQLHAALDANTLETSALTTSVLLMRLTQHFASARPDGVIICADRHETLAGMIAATYQGVPVLHLQGGEVSGNIDDRVRSANTALADWHCVSNAEAYGRVVNAGAKVDRVFITGCPSIDVARQTHHDDPVTRDELDQYGTGLSVDPQQPFTILMQHPVTTHAETAIDDLMSAIGLASQTAWPLVIFWPGADAGADDTSKVLRHMHETNGIKFVRSLPPRRFLKLLSQCALAVGNSSALIREGSYFGIPRIITGDRQQGRAWTETASNLYGDGFAAPRIADVCKRMVRE
jgi:UDP-hydrolysing UDP-N-acetyl-D-glucosamine 2-epimerase